MRKFLLIALAALVLWLAWKYLDVTSRQAPPAGQTTAAGAGKQLLRRGNGPEPESLDPHRSQIDSSANILRDLFEGLTTHTAGGNLVAGTAQSWEISADSTVYTFRLNPDAKWSNGDPLTAADFVYSFRRLVAPETASPYAQMLAAVKNAANITAGREPVANLGVSAPDPATLVVELEAPTPYFLGLLTHPSTFPVHRPSIEEHGERYGRPGNLVSNGAYTLSEWVVGSHASAQRNPLYRGNAHTAIDEVRYLHIVDETSELQRYRAGELDFTYTIPFVRYDWLKENLPDELRIAPYLTTYYYGFNLTRPPFADRLGLRRALSMAIDRELITSSVTGVGELPAYGWVPPGVNNYEPQSFDYSEWSKEERIAEAQRLYAEAGYSEENPARIELRYNTNEAHKNIAVAISRMWKENLGVETTLINEEFKVLIKNMAEKAVTEVFRSSWIGDYNDAFTFAEVLQTGHGANYVGYSNPQYDRLLEEASTESDPAKRRALLELAERTMLADQPLMPVYFYVSKHLLKPHVRGWGDNVLDYHYTRHLSLAAE